MTRIARYLKPYLIPLAIAIVLLFVQAYTNLALPDYMSDIVNVGIQQGGIDSSLPEAIRASKMDKLLIFMRRDESKEILSVYKLVQSKTPKTNKYISLYPVLSKEAVYVRKDMSPEEIKKLEPIMAKAFILVKAIEEAKTNPERLEMFLKPSGDGARAAGRRQADGVGLQAGERPGGTGQVGSSGGSTGGQPDEGSPFELSKLPPGTDIFALLKSIPEEYRSRMLGNIEEKFASMDVKMLNQIAARPIREEYKALGINTERLQMRYMLRIGLIMLIFTLISAMAAISTRYLSARIGAGFAKDLRSALFERVEKFGILEFDKFSTASLITRTTNDIMQIQMVTIMIINMVFYAPIIGIGGVIRAFQKSTSMWWIIALAVGVLIVIILTVYKFSVSRFKLLQRLMDKLNLVSREALSGMMVIRAFNRESHEEKRFDGVNKDLTKTMLFINRLMALMMPLMMFILNGLSILIIWIGAKQIENSSMQVGDMMAFMQYSMQIVFAFLILSLMFIMLPRAAVSIKRVNEVLATEPLIKNPNSPEPMTADFDGTVEFRNVSFRYPEAEEDVLHNVSFKAERGKTTAFIGTTGSGKSTIVHLILRFIDATEGTVYVGGHDVRRVDQHELRDKIGYVPQKAWLFKGTIESNLRYGDENAGEDVLEEASRISQAYDFINSFLDGMKTEISQGGGNVSGGQKQRLSIARALVKKSPIYIFDESFSALDFKTASNLMKALRTRTGSSTVLIVTQRVAAVKNADRIIVLDEGHVAGSGTHRELMEKCRIYREIATSQLTEEELV